MQSTWPSYLDFRSRSQVKGFTLKITLKFCVLSIYPEPFGWFSLNLTQMFLSLRWSAQPMSQLCRLKVKVTLQGHVIYSSVCVHSISPEPFEQFSLNFTQMFLSVRLCAEPMTQLCKVKVTLHSRSWDLPLNFVSFKSPQPIVRFSLNITQMFLSCHP